MRVWKYKTTNYENKESDSLSSTPFDGGYVIADTFQEAYVKVLQHSKEAWGEQIKLEITSLTYEHEINIP